MTKSIRVLVEGSGHQEYLGGRFYIVPDDEARAMIATGEAIDPEAEPSETVSAESSPGESGAGAVEVGAVPADEGGDA